MGTIAKWSHDRRPVSFRFWAAVGFCFPVSGFGWGWPVKITSRRSVVDIACPDCGAAVGAWCVRHGQIMPGPLLACPVRVLDSMAARLVSCPAGEMGGASRHTFPAGSGTVVSWSVFGDVRDMVEVCPACIASLWP